MFMADTFNQYKRLLQLFDKAGVPQDMRWRSLLLYLREIKEYTHLSDIQKITVQELLTSIFAQKDYSEDGLHRIIAAYHNCMVDSYRKKTDELLREIADIVQEFQKLLSARCGDLDTLEDTAVSIVEDVFESPDKLDKLHAAFAKVKKLLADDIHSLETLAASDALTGIANRRAFDAFMEKALRKWREEGRSLALAFFDIDFFKRFNDEHGHRIGDQVLVVVAKQLHKAARTVGPPDEILAARYGGEEFVIAVCGDQAARLPELVEQVRQSIKQFNFLIRDPNGNVVESGLHITVSAGIASADPEWRGAWLENIVDSADKALYYAKNNGRDRAAEFIHGEGDAFRLIEQRRPASDPPRRSGLHEGEECLLTGTCPFPEDTAASAETP
jgi:diguanylate cyclase (GGDEF)-like protein